jgi:hypothetical protein
MPGDVASVVRSWCERDRALAFLAEDRAAIDATVNARSLVVEILSEAGAHTELFRACGVLGRLLADRGASPSLAAVVIDSLRDVAATLDESTVRAARAALFEGFAAARAERARARAAAHWDYPACVVPLENASIAIAAGHPDDDEDALAAWAARVASAVARSGYRRAVIAGAEKARAALVDALELAGVTTRTTSPPSPVGKR